MIVPQTVMFVKLSDSAKPAFLRVQIRIRLAFLKTLPTLYKEVSGVTAGTGSPRGFLPGCVLALAKPCHWQIPATPVCAQSDCCQQNRIWKRNSAQ